MNYARKDTIIGYHNKFVGGYSFKTGKVFYKKDQEDAQLFTTAQANDFINRHINQNGHFKAEFITLILIDWKKKYA